MSHYRVACDETIFMMQHTLLGNDNENRKGHNIDAIHRKMAL